MNDVYNKGPWMRPIAATFEEHARRAKQALLEWRIRQLTRKDWRCRYKKIFHENPGYAAQVPGGVEQAHVSYWRQLQRDVNCNTLRVCAAISGKADPRIVPEEIFVAGIEPKLNPRREVAFLQHKSAYGHWYHQQRFPRTYLHNIDGCMFGEAYQRLKQTEVYDVLEHLPYPVVVKPNVDSLGGANVSFLQTPEAVAARIRGCRDFVVQERIKPHPFFERFSPVGLNTMRVCLYRSVDTNNMHILNVALRMGMGGSLDNETAGGIVCYIDRQGKLNPFAVDKYGVKYATHPDAGISFAAVDPIPDFVAMQSLACDLAEHVFQARLISLDVCMDADRQWRPIEINLFSQTIRFAQYAGHPFFGKYTDEVVAYCANAL